MANQEDEFNDLPLLADQLSGRADSQNCSAVSFSELSVSKKSEQRRFRRAIFVASVTSSLATVLLILGLLVAVHRFIQSRPLKWESSISSNRPGIAPCGTTTEEAISRDCVFDTLSMMWMPQKCTQSYNLEYMAANDGRPFLYWVEREEEQILDDPSLHVGGGTIFWTSRRNHVVHCEYSLYRLMGVLRSGDYISQDYGNSLLDHMHHCVKTTGEFALKAPASDIDIIDVITEPSFGYC